MIFRLYSSRLEFNKRFKNLLWDRLMPIETQICVLRCIRVLRFKFDARPVFYGIKALPLLGYTSDLLKSNKCSKKRADLRECTDKSELT